MPEPKSPSYSLGAVVRLTGLTEHTIRAWERRYGAVRPARTPGGTRRYRPEDVARLRLLASGVAAGHRISELAPHSDDELASLLAPPEADAAALPSALDPIREAVARLDVAEAEHLLALQFAARGPRAFATQVAAVLLRETGERWANGQASIGEEHLLSSVTRSVLGLALRPGVSTQEGPRLLFTTPQGERHEFGALIAAVVALAAGATVTYLGPDLPTAEVVDAAERLGADAVALGIVDLEQGVCCDYVHALRRILPERVEIWVGGPGWEGEEPGVENLDLDDLERRIAHLRRIPGNIAV